MQTLSFPNTLQKGVEMPKYPHAGALGPYQLNGKQQGVELLSVYLSAAAQTQKLKRMGMFRKKNREMV
jgi:hypothetical protein